MARRYRPNLLAKLSFKGLKMFTETFIILLRVYTCAFTAKIQMVILTMLRLSLLQLSDTISLPHSLYELPYECN